MNTTIFTGNVGNVELKDINGKKLLEFSVAETHGYTNDQGTFVELGTTWRECAVWEKKAERLADKIVKGASVLVYGDEITKTNEKDGKVYHNRSVTVKEVGFTAMRIDSITFKTSNPK